jgi:ribonuclease HI
MSDETPEVILHFDGGIREGIMAYGYVAFDPDDGETVLFEGCNRCGSGTSNVAEYRALLAGLYACRKTGIRRVRVVGDSQLVVNQVKGAWKINKEDLRQHRDKALELFAEFESWSIKWVRRNQNKHADMLVGEVFARMRGKPCKRKAE